MRTPNRPPADEPQTEAWTSLSEPVVEALPPRIGRYAVSGQLGRGGMGVVYQAWDEVEERAVALKVISGERVQDENAQRRFRREARACGQLRHPNLIRLLDVGQHEDSLFFTMPLLQGPTLSARLRQEGALPPSEVAWIGAKLAEALAYVHAQGLVHRDVKPGNVMFDDGEPILTDFGLVKEASPRSTQLTRESKLIGTLPYLAPELLHGGAARANAASDQYALGVLLYVCLAAALPFGQGTPVELAGRVLAGDAPRLERRGVPAGLARVVHRALSPDPADRYPDMRTMAEALSRWQEWWDPITLSRDLWRRLRFELRRPRPLRGALAAAVALVALAVGAGVLRGERAESQARARWEAARASMEAARAEGREEEAARLFEAFVAFPDNQGTRALPQAWLHEGEAGLTQDASGALHAFTSAWVLAEHAEERRRALLGLAKLMAQAERWEPLAHILAQPDARGGGFEAPRAALQAATGALDEAGAFYGGALGRALTALAPTTTLAQPGTAAWSLPGEPGRLLIWETPELPLRVLGLTPQPELLGEGPILPASATLFVPVDEPGSAAAVLRGDHLGCQAWDEALQVIGEWRCSGVQGVARADLDQDGLSELLVADIWRLERAAQGAAEAWEMEPVEVGTRSHLRAMTQLDWRGRRYVALGIGGWSAYDLRVFVAQAGALELHGRAQLGVVASVVALEAGGEVLLAALQVNPPNQGLSRWVFGEALPHSEPLGIYLYALTEDGLAPRGFLPEVGVDTLQVRQPLIAADLDGDGQDELVLSRWRGGARVYALEGQGWRGVTLRGLRPQLAADVDGDGADELLVHVEGGSALRWLGVGERGTAAPFGALDEPKVPEAVQGRMASEWRRAERLVAVGLLEQAAERFGELAARWAGQGAEGLAWMREGELLETLGQLEGAGAAYLMAAKHPDLAAAGSRAAARLLSAERRWRALAALPVGLRPADAPKSLSQVLSAPSTRLRFGGAWPEPVLPETGLGLSLRGDALELKMVGDVDALRLAVTRVGPWTRLALELDPQTLGWSYGVFLSLEGPGATGALGWHAFGGGGVTQWSATCLSDPERGWAITLPPLAPDEVRQGGPWTLVFEQLDGADEASCVLLEGDKERARAEIEPFALPAEGQPLTLRLAGRSARVHHGRVQLRGIAMEGLVPLPATPDAYARALLAWLSGQSREAAALLGQLEGESAAVELLRALVAEDLGDAAGARRALLRALALDDTLGGARESLVVIEPLRLNGALRDALGVDYAALVADAYAPVLLSEGPSAAHAPLFAALLGEEGEALRGASPDVAALLHLLRGAALVKQGRYAPAERALRAARALDVEGEYSRQTHLQLASVMVATHRPAEALAELNEGLERSARPEELADRACRDEGLRALHDAPGWDAICARRRVPQEPPGSLTPSR